MNRHNWKDIAELVGIAAIVASLVFLALEVRQTQDIALTERAYSGLYGRLELNLAVADHAEIWTKGNAGSDLNEAEQTVYQKLIENQIWVSWNSWSSARRFDQDRPRDLAVADFAAFLAENPGARRVWQAYYDKRESARRRVVPDYEANTFKVAVDTYLAELLRN